MCDFYPGVSCGDPRFTGGDGNNFYFHGKRDQDFCILSDANLHINAHFIGKRNPSMRRDFTWIQALGIRFAHHRLYLGAQKTAKWSSDVDLLELALDDEPVSIPAEAGARWESAAVPGLSVTRTTAANGVRVQLAGVLDIMASVVPITEEDSMGGGGLHAHRRPSGCGGGGGGRSPRGAGRGAAGGAALAALGAGGRSGG